MISPAQMKAIGAKTNNIAKATGVEQAQIYQSAVAHLGINNKSTKELTSQEASKVIEYLSTLE